MVTPISNRIEKNVIAGVDYTFNPTHRNRTRGKSQWDVSEEVELTIFLHSDKNEWSVNNQYAWGLHLVEGGLTYLGFAQDHETRVFIAKFVNDISHDNWHGYPADHQVNNQDRPPEEILSAWMTKGVMKPAKVRKIMRGQTCKL